MSVARRAPVRHGDPRRDLDARDYAVRGLKRHLKDQRRTPRTVNKVLAGIDNLYRHLGLGPPNVRREDLPQQAPRALGGDEQRQLLRAVERRGIPRDRALVTLALFAGLRLAEMAALDVDDVAVTARKGIVRVRHGKGDAYREVPLGPDTRAVIHAWLQTRTATA